MPEKSIFFLAHMRTKQLKAVESYVIKSSVVEELLGVTIDSNLNFNEHTLSLCKKTNRKFHALILRF